MRWLIGTAYCSSILLGAGCAAMAADIPVKAPIAMPGMASALSWSGCTSAQMAAGCMRATGWIVAGRLLSQRRRGVGTTEYSGNRSPAGRSSLAAQLQRKQLGLDRWCAGRLQQAVRLIGAWRRGRLQLGAPSNFRQCVLSGIREREHGWLYDFASDRKRVVFDELVLHNPGTRRCGV